MDMQPSRPKEIDPIADEMLAAFEGHPEAGSFVLAGYFALKHYLDYRPTRDVDAWWSMESLPPERAAAVELAKKTLQRIVDDRGLELVDRSWKAVTSLEVEQLTAEQKKETIFSFQVAERDIQLEEPVQSSWPPLKLETLRENLASKMTALVKRGAPRDFVDIRMVVQSGIATVDQVWDLWQQRNPGVDMNFAKAHVVRSLSQIELRVPIDSVPEHDRARISEARAWIRNELTHSPVRDRQRDRGREALGPEL